MLQILASYVACSSSTELVVHLKHRNAAALESAFWSIATPGDAQYLQFRSVEQLAAEFGASRESVAAATSWLTSELGASPSALRVSPMKNTITATVPSPLTAGDAAWTLSASGLAIPRVPNALVATVDFIVRRDGAATAATAAAAAPSVTNAPNGGYTIAQQKAAYGIPVGLESTNPATLQMVKSTLLSSSRALSLKPLTLLPYPFSRRCGDQERSATARLNFTNTKSRSAHS